MRALVLSAIVLVICICAIARPKIGILGYVWFALMRPDVLAWVQGQRQYSMYLAVATLIGSIRFAPQIIPLFKNPIWTAVLTLVIPIIASAFYAVDPPLSADPLEQFLKMIMVVLLIPLYIQTLKDFRLLFLTIAFSLGVIGTKFGVYGLLAGGARFYQGYGGMMDGNNEVGMAFAMVLPFCWYAIRIVESKKMKLFYLGVIVSTIAGAIMTYSRGAALGLAAVFLTLVFFSKRKLGILIGLAIVVLPGLYFVSESYLDRLATIQAPAEDHSISNRLLYWDAALKIAEDYPLLGTGFGQKNTAALMARYLEKDDQHVIHNTYLQLAADCGFFTAGLFILILLGTISWLGLESLRLKRSGSRWAIFPIAVQCALIAYAVSGTFGSRERYDFYYILLMTAASWYTVRNDLQPEAGTDESHEGETDVELVVADEAHA